jgi:peptidoglycan hydrolase-like protein with peptidoglycan-binding domain
MRPVGIRLALLASTIAVAAIAAPAAVAVNPQIAGIQVALRAYGLYVGAIDGVAGPGTRAALRSFQQHAGLAPTGAADAATRRALGPLGGPLLGRRTLARGAFGADVAVLQFLLSRRGLYRGAIEGYFDAATQLALRRFQLAERLVADGVAGPATLERLGAGAGVPLAPPQPHAPPAPAVYVVRPGDTLAAIAARASTTVGALARLNRIETPDAIVVGARLQLPPPTPALDLVAGCVAIRATIDRWAATYGLDPQLARALAWMESGYQHAVVSNVGARGIYQVLPVTWRFVEQSLLGQRIEASPDGDVRVGLAYLRYLLERFHGDERLALAAWYQGPKALEHAGVYDVTVPFVADVLALAGRSSEECGIRRGVDRPAV